MDQKIKIALIGLIGICVIFMFLYIQALGSKQSIIKEQLKLGEEKKSLEDNLQKLRNSLREYESKVQTLNKDLDKVKKEKIEAEKKYELTVKTRDELVEKLKSRQVKETVTTPASKPSEEAAVTKPMPDDTYWAGILKSKTDLELQLDKIRAELKSVQTNNENLQREKNTLELYINDLKKEKDDLTRQIDYNQKLVDSLSNDLVREKNDKMQIQEALKSFKNENKVVLRQLENLNSRNADLDKKLQEIKEEKTKQEAKFSEMEAMLTQKLMQADRFKQQLEDVRSGKTIEEAQEKRESVILPPIVVRPAAEPEITAMSSGFYGTGKVLAVNKENKFVVIDVGEEEGVKIGDVFKVERAGKAIAEVQVIQLRKNIAACDIKKEIVPVAIADTIKK
jgi:hypothetical protein